MLLQLLALTSDNCTTCIHCVMYKRQISKTSDLSSGAGPTRHTLHITQQQHPGPPKCLPYRKPEIIDDRTGPVARRGEHSGEQGHCCAVWEAAVAATRQRAGHGDTVCVMNTR